MRTALVFLILFAGCAKEPKPTESINRIDTVAVSMDTQPHRIIGFAVPDTVTISTGVIRRGSVYRMPISTKIGRLTLTDEEVHQLDTSTAISKTEFHYENGGFYIPGYEDNRDPNRMDTTTTYQIHKCNGEILRDTILTITKHYK